MGLAHVDELCDASFDSVVTSWVVPACIVESLAAFDDTLSLAIADAFDVSSLEALADVDDAVDVLDVSDIKLEVVDSAEDDSDCGLDSMLARDVVFDSLDDRCTALLDLADVAI